MVSAFLSCLFVGIGFVLGVLFTILLKRTAILVGSRKMPVGTYRTAVAPRNNDSYYLVERVVVDKTDPAAPIITPVLSAEPLIVKSSDQLPSLFEARKQKVVIVPV